MHRNVWNSERLDYSELSNILPRAVEGEHFAKRTEKCIIFGHLLDEKLETLEDHGCPTVQCLVDKQIWICSS